MNYIIEHMTAKHVVKNLSLLKTETNKVRITFGLSNAGGGYVTCLAVIVQGGQQLRLGFKAKSKEENSYSCIVSCKEFVEFLSALCVANADITVKGKEKTLTLSVKSLGELPLKTYAEEEAEPLLPDEKSVGAQIVLPKAFSDTVSRGGFLATLDDNRNTNCVAMHLYAGHLKVFSTNLNTIAKSWCEVTSCKVDTSNRAMCFLVEKLKSSSEEAQAVLKKKIQAVGKDGAALVGVAKEEGYQADGPLKFGIPTAGALVLSKVFSGEEVKMLLGAKRAYFAAPGIQLSITLSEGIPSLYSNIEKEWEKPERWPMRVVFDKAGFIQALGVVKLDRGADPLKLSKNKNGIVLEKGGLKAYVPVTASDGDVDCIEEYHSFDAISRAVARLGEGNCTLYSEPDGKVTQISNGDLDGVIGGRIFIRRIDKSTLAAAEAAEAKEEATEIV